MTTRSLISLLLLLSLAEGRPGQSVLQDSLTTTAIDPAWTVELSTNNTLHPTPDGIEIVAAENTFAHIQRTLGVDHVRVSCRIRPGAGISWCSSIFVYWAPGDWCQLGVIPRGDGRYYVCVTSSGQRNEYDLARCDFQAWHQLGIELGNGIIRFVSSPDGQSWTTRLVVPRPPPLLGPPELLVLGKGYGLGNDAPDLDSDYGDRGPLSRSKVRDLVVSPLPPERLEQSLEERRAEESAGQDPLGQGILSAPGDPTFDSVAGLLPALSQPREVVGVKDHPYEIGVDHQGTLQIDTGQDGWQQAGPRAFFDLNGTRFGASGCRKRLWPGGLPIVVASLDSAGLACEQTVFGWSDGLSDSTPLWAYVQLRVTSPMDRTVAIAFRVTPEQLGIAPLRHALHLAAGGSAEICLKMPAPLDGRSPSEVAAGEFAQRLSEVTNAWTRLLDAGTRIHTPEPRVNEAYRAWLAYNFLNVDRKDGLYRIHDGGGFYEAVFGYSAVLFCHALDLWGHHDDARRYLDSMLQLQRPDGLFFSNYGYPDTGSLLLAAAQHHRLAPDTNWLQSAAPRLVKMCNWIIRQRKESMKEIDGKRPVTWGLVQFTPYADYPNHTFNYYGDTYGCVGLEQTAWAMKSIGRQAESERLAAEAASYRKDILASMDAAKIERDGLTILPMEPDTHRLLQSTHYRAGGYYGLIASMLLENEFLPAGDPRARWIAGFMEKRHGLILGLCEFDEGVDHAYTYGYWLNCLHRDEIRRVLLGFYGTLAYGMGRDTYCGVEVTQILTGRPTATTPHTYSGTQQLRLLRMMLLREERNGLLLGPAIPHHWLRPGQKIEVRNAPTAFGPVSFTIESAPGELRAHLTPPERVQPGFIHLRLRQSEEKPIASVQVNGRSHTAFTRETIELPTTREPLDVRVWY